jgi:spermidine/putrescine transport system permease protein
MPGVFAGTLLTFIPASGDFINAHLLGDANKPVIGYVIQLRFIQGGDFPAAAAISLVLMAIITVMVLIYSKFLGTDDLV